MLLKANNPTYNTIIVFVIIMCLLYIFKPNVIYDHRKKEFRQFGITNGKTILPIYIVGMLFSILLYILFYYVDISINKKQSNASNISNISNISNVSNVPAIPNVPFSSLGELEKRAPEHSYLQLQNQQLHLQQLQQMQQIHQMQNQITQLVNQQIKNNMTQNSILPNVFNV